MLRGGRLIGLRCHLAAEMMLRRRLLRRGLRSSTADSFFLSVGCTSSAALSSSHRSVGLQAVSSSLRHWPRVSWKSWIWSANSALQLTLSTAALLSRKSLVRPDRGRRARVSCSSCASGVRCTPCLAGPASWTVVQPDLISVAVPSLPRTGGEQTLQLLLGQAPCLGHCLFLPPAEDPEGDGTLSGPACCVSCLLMA